MQTNWNHIVGIAKVNKYIQFRDGQMDWIWNQKPLSIFTFNANCSICKEIKRRKSKKTAKYLLKQKHFLIGNLMHKYPTHSSRLEI